MNTTDPRPNRDGSPPSPAAQCSATVYSTHHMCVDIEGVLRWSNTKLSRLFTDDGIQRPGRTLRDWLKLQLAQGKRVLPIGEKCEGWSDVTGCPGHPCKPDGEPPNDKLSDPAHQTLSKPETHGK